MSILSQAPQYMYSRKHPSVHVPVLPKLCQWIRTLKLRNIFICYMVHSVASCMSVHTSAFRRMCFKCFFQKRIGASKGLPFKCHRDGFVHSACRSGHQLRDFEVHGQCRGVAARVALAHQRQFCARILVMNCVTIV